MGMVGLRAPPQTPNSVGTHNAHMLLALLDFPPIMFTPGITSVEFFFKSHVCSLVLMMLLTISPLHCSVYAFISHLSSLIVLDFISHLLPQSFFYFFFDL